MYRWKISPDDHELVRLTIPDSEVDDCIDDTVEVEDSDMDRRLWIASTWEDNSSKRLRKYLEISFK